MNFTEDLFLSLRHVLSRLVTQKTSRVKEWFGKNKQILAATIFVIAIIYFIPYTFMLGDRWKTIVGIILQILAGAILVFEQILANDRIKNQTTKIIRQPPVFALLMTFISFPFAISILTALGKVPPNKWLAAREITVGTAVMFGAFLTSIMLLQRIKRLGRKDHVPSTKDKLDISDLSPRNVGILFGASVLIMIFLICLSRLLISHKELWIQMLWVFLFFVYGFTLLPLLIIAPLYFLAFGFIRFTNYIHTKKSLEVWFWIFLFVLWAWGWLLLLLAEFT
ncbi:MAG: hypothetical protein ACOC6R_02605 [Chloroflexota bacterium]